MASSGSMFLMEIIVSELRSYVKCREFIIKSQFADVFSIILKDPTELDKALLPKKSSKRKTKVKKNLRPICKPENKVQSGQSVLFTDNLENLVSNMKMYPIELSLWSKVYPKYKIASTTIPWSTKCVDYLNKIGKSKDPRPVTMTGDYNVFNEATSRRMAIIKLSIKLTYLADKITTQFRSLSEDIPETFMYSNFNSEPATVLTKVQDKPFNLAEEIGIIKTLYSNGKKKVRKASWKSKTVKSLKDQADLVAIDLASDTKVHQLKEITNTKKVNSSIISLVRSHTDIDKNKQIDLTKSKSCSSINRDHLNILNYIFGDKTGPFGNQVFCVGYFTVENDKVDSQSPKSSSKISAKSSENFNTSDKLSANERLKLKICDDECVSSSADLENLGFDSLDLPKELSNAVTISKCKNIDCKHKVFRKLPPPPDERILLDLTSLKQECCDKTENVETVEKIEEVVGGMVAQMKFGEDPCYCVCKCDFGFTKKTKYCTICGGYEKVGEQFSKSPILEFPCPVYHNLMDKPKLKPVTSDSKKASKARSIAEKSIESEKESKKGKKKKKDKFKFNYGYTAPHIGHDNCALPCAGTLGQVPKKMGWLWTAENIPGMKFRPLWKPGAVNKHVLRLLRMARHPGENFAKKRKKDAGKSKRPLKRPLLVVHKKDGEYTVAMETMKAYSKPRAINQVPYEDKPAVTYTIGRTEEENRQRRIKKERARRRLERSQREFIQSAFRDMCQEICLKTYQQALGILPNAEDPNCPCYPADPGPDKTDLDHSCSCSEDSKLTGSDTDSDEWIIEFTPPTATFDQSYKTKKITCVENTSQYTYMDYRVKLLDRYGNPVPRFFKGPDGKEQCSDLGGFWGPGNKWLEINVDGYIGKDGKWAPNNFIGPNGEQVDAELGKFQSMDGRWLVVGIDGYVDVNGKWRFYSRTKATLEPKKRRVPVAKKGKAASKKETAPVSNKSDATWSCFGDANPKHLSKLGILGHGHDRKLLLQTLNRLIAQGEDVKIPEPSFVPRSHRKKGKAKFRSDLFDTEMMKCHHPVPSNKGVVAVDENGNKIYFKFSDVKNKRSKQRITTLTDQGISVSSFHVPCFHSFISAEVMKKQQYRRLLALAKKHGYVEKRPPRPESKPQPKYRNVIV